MNAHPGGEGHTRHMLEIATLPKGSRICDRQILSVHPLPLNISKIQVTA